MYIKVLGIGAILGEFLVRIYRDFISRIPLFDIKNSFLGYKKIIYDKKNYAPEWNSGAYSFCPVCDSVSDCDSVCLWLCGKNFNLGHNFWTVKDRDSIFGIHTQLINPFQMTPRSMTLWPWPWYPILDFVAAGAFVFHKHIRLLISKNYIDFLYRDFDVFISRILDFIISRFRLEMIFAIKKYFLISINRFLDIKNRSLDIKKYGIINSSFQLNCFFSNNLATLVRGLL